MAALRTLRIDFNVAMRVLPRSLLQASNLQKLSLLYNHR